MPAMKRMATSDQHPTAFNHQESGNVWDKYFKIVNYIYSEKNP